MPPSWPHFHLSYAQQSVDLQWILCHARFRIAPPTGAQQRRSLSATTAAIRLIMPVPPQPQSSAAFAILQLHRNFFLPDHADEIRDYHLDTRQTLCYRPFMVLRLTDLEAFLGESASSRSDFNAFRTGFLNTRRSTCSVVNSCAFFLAKVDSL